MTTGDKLAILMLVVVSFGLGMSIGATKADSSWRNDITKGRISLQTNIVTNVVVTVE